MCNNRYERTGMLAVSIEDRHDQAAPSNTCGSDRTGQVGNRPSKPRPVAERTHAAGSKNSLQSLGGVVRGQGEVLEGPKFPLERGGVRVEGVRVLAVGVEASQPLTQLRPCGWLRVFPSCCRCFFCVPCFGVAPIISFVVGPGFNVAPFVSFVVSLRFLCLICLLFLPNFVAIPLECAGVRVDGVRVSAVGVVDALQPKTQLGGGPSGAGACTHSPTGCSHVPSSCCRCFFVFCPQFVCIIC
mmetsp:Transcript_47476/g.88143  ORF Transcript_47476/g.88143 Transcript_47476/m.88143 type:complete len:242 (+) Transcript_47476:416-1141(+)